MLSIDDLKGEFDPSWGWMKNPNIAFAPNARGEMYSQYVQLFRDRYLENGDVNIAKKQAANQLKKVWGVTNINGTEGMTGGGVVMQFPPERSPAYDGIENFSDKYAHHAIETIKAETGKDVKRESLRIVPIPGVTAGQFKKGDTPQYSLMWQDENGLVQALQPGKAFAVTAEALRATQTQQRQAAFERAAAGHDAGQSYRDSEMAAFMPPSGGEDGVPEPDKPREILPGIGDVAAPGGVLPDVADAGEKSSEPYRSYWQSGRGGSGFRAAVSPPDRAPSRTEIAEKK